MSQWNVLYCFILLALTLQKLKYRQHNFQRTVFSFRTYFSEWDFFNFIIIRYYFLLFLLFIFQKILLRIITSQPKLQLNMSILTSMKKTHCFNFLFSKAAQEPPVSVWNLDLKKIKPPQNKTNQPNKKPPSMQKWWLSRKMLLQPLTGGYQYNYLILHIH